MPETQVLADTRIAMVKDPDGNIVELNERPYSLALRGNVDVQFEIVGGE